MEIPFLNIRQKVSCIFEVRNTKISPLKEGQKQKLGTWLKLDANIDYQQGKVYDISVLKW